MKINELFSSSSLPGARGQRVTSRELTPADKQRIAKFNLDKWYSIVKKKMQDGVDMNNENNYRKALYNFASGNKKLKLNKDLKNAIGRGNIKSDADILNIMNLIIDARAQAKAAPANDTTQNTGAL